jgi:predicted dehydrogenase
MPSKPDRRAFLQSSAALGAAGVGIGYWVAGGVAAAQNTSPNEQIQFACIGVGGKGKSDSADAARSGQVVAICDVDETSLERSGPRLKDAARYFDFRRMLDEMGDKIDAVTVSTPDHNHAVAAVMAMRMGKATFCQKPLTRSLHEARVMTEVARESGVATMMGNQGTALDSLRKAAAVARSGVLGDISAVHVWTNRPIWPQGIERPTEIKGNPNTLHWDEWIGPAPYRPYHEAYHPFKWRGFWDFGTGALGDMACHTLNMPYMALELRDPIAVTAETSGHNKETYPGWSVINFEFPARGDRGPVKLTWYDGGKRPDAALFGGTQPEASGALIVGSNGKLYATGDYADDFKLLGGLETPQVEFEKSPGHFEEWVDAIKGGKPAMANFADYAGPLTETILLGNLAVWVGEGKRVEWDAANLRSPNMPELASFVNREFRDGYTL